ncbi:hypothetical protein MmonteBS_26170 [Mycobacterium montefiorense]|uniref:Uncharacterized protein n=1 Tax=Mycobacterium montefiorense TaxID=154654 RepID=A0ABQ0NN08_9MYCO|nr:hypothetical protein MmonteBS_26170 [Mycobacterium montefiorense]
MLADNAVWRATAAAFSESQLTTARTERLRSPSLSPPGPFRGPAVSDVTVARKELAVYSNSCQAAAAANIGPECAPEYMSPESISGGNSP